MINLYIGRMRITPVHEAIFNVFEIIAVLMVAGISNMLNIASWTGACDTILLVNTSET